ncbi:hypothetical protein EOE18_00005 [Novosphingobium umbonatum]|uniref:Uncharacterized protein n=1 Tax=Novosphingobium umbonatum TaxID=1908524 RepID=A0A3S2VWD7_9SPHN|nr:hypothetical protein [Novosphingobium umbonatum]RVU07520.1 hypothetical protein EOE18_00005 [Novosphingobium umbonatum]
MPNPQITFPAAFAPAQAVAFANGDNSAQVVSQTAPLPVTVTNAASGGGAMTEADGANVALGAKADAAATSDTGAFSLIALTKRLLGKLPASLGQKTAANSLPVVLPSDMGALPVSAAALPLPAGAATADNQGTANTALAAILAKLIAAPATAANQATANASLSAIAAQLPASLGQKTAAGSLPVTLPSDMATLPVSNTDGVADGATQTASVTSAAVVLSLDTLGYASGSFQITSIGSGNTVSFEQSNDGTNWTALPVNLATTPFVAYASTATVTGIFNFGIIARYVRARVSTYSSGTVTITSCLKRTKGDTETVLSTVISGGTATIGSIAAYAGYIEYTTSLAANAALPSPVSRVASANPSASYFNARAYSDQAGTMTIEQTINSGGTWEVVASTAVSAGVVAFLRIPTTGHLEEPCKFGVASARGVVGGAGNAVLRG